MCLRVVILVFAATCCTELVFDHSDKQSAWEQSGKFEGDIMLTEEELGNNAADVSPKKSAGKRSGKFEGDILLPEEQMRNVLINSEKRWTNKTVPFVIDSVFNDNERNLILHAIDDFHQKTPIRFKEYDQRIDTDYIYVSGKESGCWSYVGRIGKEQELNLQRDNCLPKGTIIHELLHALGFYHQHSAIERDEYVTINWENIEPGAKENFSKYNASTITSFGVPYDYDSVMHYGPYAFSKNKSKLKTTEPKDPKAAIGQREGFSAKDIEKVIKMYPDVSDKQSVWERSGKFQGDIMLTEEQMTNGLIKPPSLWPNRVVPFHIDDLFTGYERKQIGLAILDYFLMTSIRFKKYDPLTDTDYIHITGEDDGCWSYVGRIEGVSYTVRASLRQAQHCEQHRSV